VKREVVPQQRNRRDMEQFIRNWAVTHWHQSCTAKMGRDAMSVVDHQLRVYGVDNLRIADASIMPRITVSNTMAPCVVIGERAAGQLAARRPVSKASGRDACYIASSAAIFRTALCDFLKLARRLARMWGAALG
jgi:choline dehydrogenase